MSPLTASLLRIAAIGALAAPAAGCKAFNLGPETEAAVAANAAAPGYPQLVDVPPEPADVACVRAALSDSLIVAETPRPASPFADDETDVFDGDAAGVGLGAQDLVQYRAVQANAQPQARQSVVSVFRGLAGEVLGEEDEEEPADQGRAFIDCPPGPGVQADRLTAAREELARVAAELRAQRPTAPDVTIDLPADMPSRAAPESGNE